MDGSLLFELLHPDCVPGAQDLGCSVAHAIVNPNESTLPHRLHQSTELYYILSGTGRIHIDDERADLRSGQIVLIPPGSVQYIVNTGLEDLVFLCIVSPKWRAADETLACGTTDVCAHRPG